MIALLCLLEKQLILLHLLFVGERDSVRALQGVVIGIAQPVRGAVLCHLERFYLARVGNVGTHAKIDESVVAVRGRRVAILDFIFDNFDLKGLSANSSSASSFDSMIRSNFSSFWQPFFPRFKRFQICRRERLLAHVRIVVESRIDGWSDAQLGALLALHALPKHALTSARIPFLHLCLQI